MGNVNVSRFGPRLAGAGGFINISQNARRVVFAGTFTATGLDVAIRDASLVIRKEGSARKFLEEVEQITFSGARAARQGQPVLCVTERGVFELDNEGLKLVEIARGVDLERDIISQMDVAPIIDELREMDGRIFRDEEMGLSTDLLHLDLPDRIALDGTSGRLFLNFEKMRIRTAEEIERVRLQVTKTCATLDSSADVIFNQDGFQIDAAHLKDWSQMVEGLTEPFYRNVSRYSGSAFMRMKLQVVFPEARTHFFETKDQAHSFLEAQRTHR
jgi:propionate CoA-transferase